MWNSDLFYLFAAHPLVIASFPSFIGHGLQEDPPPLSLSLSLTCTRARAHAHAWREAAWVRFILLQRDSARLQTSPGEANMCSGVVPEGRSPSVWRERISSLCGLTSSCALTAYIWTRWLGGRTYYFQSHNKVGTVVFLLVSFIISWCLDRVITTCDTRCFFP